MTTANDPPAENQPAPPLPPHRRPADGLQTGEMLAGRYRIEGLLGAGGMGQVYKARDTELDIAVAIKVLPGVLARNGPSISALKREATLSLRLSHPNICRLHHFHADEGTKFLVMELIAGRTLEAMLDDADDRRLSVDAVARLARDVAEALDYAHSLDPPILHLDIKPSNIMVLPDGRAKVLDFGIARQMKDSMTRVTGKETSGTLLYMAPEQYEGRDPTTASDIYAFAATLYECLAGHAPFYQGAIGHQVLNMPPAELTGVPARVNKALQAGLAKRPADRPATAAALVEMLTTGSVAAGGRSAAQTRPAVSLAQTIVTKSISVLKVNAPATGAAGAMAAGSSKPKGWRVGGMLLEPWKVLVAGGGLLAVIVLLAALAGGGEDTDKKTGGGAPPAGANAGDDPTAPGGATPPGGAAPAGNGGGAPAPAGQSEAETAAYQAKLDAEALQQKANSRGAFRSEMSQPDGQYREGMLAMGQRNYEQARKQFLDAQAGYRLALANAERRSRETAEKTRRLIEGANRF